jgi:hypothetical protein
MLFFVPFVVYCYFIRVFIMFLPWMGGVRFWIQGVLFVCAYARSVTVWHFCLLCDFRHAWRFKAILVSSHNFNFWSFACSESFFW